MNFGVNLDLARSRGSHGAGVCPSRPSIAAETKVSGGKYLQPYAFETWPAANCYAVPSSVVPQNVLRVTG